MKQTYSHLLMNLALICCNRKAPIIRGLFLGNDIGIIFHNTKLPLQEWFMAMYLISFHKKGILSRQLLRDIVSH